MNQLVKIFKYIVSLILLVISLDGNAQYLEKRQKDWKPSEFFLSVDVVGPAIALSTGDLKFEIQGKVDFDRYYLALDWGVEQLELAGDDFEYGARGNFFRVGPQINLMPYNELRSNIYAGFMYGQANFSDEVVYDRSVDYWSIDNLRYANTNLVSRWAEFNMGINGKLYKNFYMGFLIRFKFANSLSEVDVLSPYIVPGYGKADKPNRFGFNYYLTYRIPFRDKPIPTKPRYIAAPEESNEKPSNSGKRQREQ